MEHVHLTCKVHPMLRWSCKEIAYTPGYGYNGQRNLFFLGMFTGYGPSKWTGAITEQYSMIHPITNEIVHECDCGARQLILAPEEKLTDEELKTYPRK